MKENWKQAGGKRLLALVLTLVMMVGLMPQGSVKAAGEVDATVTVTGSQKRTSDNCWLIYADLSNAMTANVTVNQSLAKMNATVNNSGTNIDGTEIGIWVIAVSAKEIYYLIYPHQLNPSDLTVGTTLTFKAQNMAGYFNMKNDLTLYWTGSAWKELRKLDISTIAEQWYHVLITKNPELQTLVGSYGNNVMLTGVGDACVYLNGNPTSKTTIEYRYNRGLWLDAASIKGSSPYVAGDIVRVKGVFTQTVNPAVCYEMDDSYFCVRTNPGTSSALWAYRSDLSIKTSTKGSLHLFADKILTNGSDYNVTSGGGTVTYNDKAIYRDNDKKDNFLGYSAKEDALYMMLSEYGITEPKTGDVIYIAGTFNANGKVVNFAETWFMLQADGTWKQYVEKPEPEPTVIDTTLSVHSGWGDQSAAATVMPNETKTAAIEASLTLKTGDYLAPQGDDAGIWYNGERLDPSKGLYLHNGSTYVRYQVILKDYGRTVQMYDMITIKGLFVKDDVRLNFQQINLRYNGSQWEAVSYCYEDTTVFSLEEVLSATAQDVVENDLHRWLFIMKPSKLLEAGIQWDGFNDKLNVKIYHEDEPDVVTTATPYALHASWNKEDGYLGMFINFKDGNGNDLLPKNADGYVMAIQPGIFRGKSDANHYYVLNKEFLIKNIGGKWVIPQERPEGIGIKGDANGDGLVDVRDIVREKLELAGLTGTADIALCTKDALLHKTERLTKEDLISLYEIILGKNDPNNTMPVYLDDNKMMLAAYEGPRRGGLTNYHADEKKNLVNDGVVNRSYLNAREFRRFADAGLNTVYVQADASFDSMALKGAGVGMLQNLNNYMDLAADAGVDVIVYSDFLSSYLRNDTPSKKSDGTEILKTEENLKIELDELWNGHSAARGMREYENFKGIMMSDELDSERFNAYQSAAGVIKGISKDIGMYSSQFSMRAAYTHFKDFGGLLASPAVRFTNAAKAFGGVAGNFAYDMYPLLTEKSGNTDYAPQEWLWNLQLLAEAGRDNGFDTGVTVQSMGHLTSGFTYYPRDPVNRADIGFQVYTALAYGMKSISYYTYWEHHTQNNSEIYTSAMVLYPDDPEAADAEGVETDVYRAVAAVNNEINQFDHVFMEYDWRGTMALKGSNKDKMYDDLNSYSSDRIVSANATNDALIGCMYDAEQGYDGFWLVNGTAPNNAGDAAITVKFAGDVKKLMVYDPTDAGFNGRAKIVPYDAVNGYKVTLKCGEGQFVIPLLIS